MFDQIQNVPAELKLYRQWVVWRYEDTANGKPTKVPYSPISGKLAKVNDPQTWSSFEEALQAMATGWYNGVGFVLTSGDPFTFIDLDNPEGDDAVYQRQMQIYHDVGGYAERSPSGNGLHIICRGSVPSGRRRGKIEVYSENRYMTMTGNVYREGLIEDHSDQVTALYNLLGHGAVAATVYAGLAEAKESDETIYNKAMSAANGEKFVSLFRGEWQGAYSSQSEADFALVDIIAFYTQNRAQIARMFGMSGLGQREKAKRVDYVAYMLNKCFDRMLPPIDIAGLQNQLEAAQMKSAQAATETGSAVGFATPVATINDMTTPNDIYSLPPGLVGEIAEFIYSQAPRPVREIALAGALGLMAGIVGRAYNVSGTGLNQYVLLLAPTGTGKEAIASGIDKLMGAVLKTVPSSADYIGPGEIASPQALVKYMARGQTSFVSMVGEFGIYLQQMAAVNAAPHLMGLRRMILDLYNKSGQGKVLRPSIYSDKEKNTAAVLSPAFTILGESTPEKFYEALHEGMITEGLVPRFTLIEYAGKRPPLNRGHSTARPSYELVDKLATLCANAATLNSQNVVCHVDAEPAADQLLNEFDNFATFQINESSRDVQKQLWTRAHMKALKLAGSIAVGENPYRPTISLAVAHWAIALVSADVRNFLLKFETGDVGVDNDENKQIAKVIEYTRDFVLKPWPEVAKYAGDGAGVLHSNKVVPYSYIQRRCAAVAVFRKDRQGATTAIKRAIKTLCERGDLAEVSRPKMATEYGTSAVAYMIQHPGVFGF